MEKGIGVLALLGLIGFAIWGMSQYGASQDAEYAVWHAAVVQHQEACMDAYMVDFADDDEKDIVAVYNTAYSNPNGPCYVYRCKVVEGWDKSKTFQPNRADCTGAKMVEFYLKYASTTGATI